MAESLHCIGKPKGLVMAPDRLGDRCVFLSHILVCSFHSEFCHYKCKAAPGENLPTASICISKIWIPVASYCATHIQQCRLQAEIAALLEKAGASSSKQVEQNEEAAALKVSRFGRHSYIHMSLFDLHGICLMSGICADAVVPSVCCGPSSHACPAPPPPPPPPPSGAGMGSPCWLRVHVFLCDDLNLMASVRRLHFDHDGYVRKSEAAAAFGATFHGSYPISRNARGSLEPCRI